MAEKAIWTLPGSGLPEPARLARWGSFGVPVLLFPSAGGDCEEIERCGIVTALDALLASGRIKLYSVDGIAARSWLAGRGSIEQRSAVQNGYDAWIAGAAVATIRADCRDAAIEIIAAGAALGAFDAVASICRHPQIFRSALGLSGRYDRAEYLGGAPFTEDFYFSSPLHYLPGLGPSPQLDALRRRFILLASGAGDYEDPRPTERLAQLLAEKRVPQRVDLWGTDFPHDWNTWRAMLLQYLAELA